MSWAEKEPSRPGLSVAQLGDDETATFRAIGDPYREETAKSDDALHIPVEPIEFPDGLTDMSGDPIEAGSEYNIINSSTTFYEALCRALGIEPGDSYDGTIQTSTFTVSASQPDEGDQFSRTYTVEFE